MDPPIQTEYFRSGGATILIFMEEGARAVISRCMLKWGCKDEGVSMDNIPVSNTRVHGGTSRENNVSIEILSDINVALHDRVVGGLVDSGGFQSKEGRLEEGLWGTETLVSNGDDLSIWEFVALLQRRRLGGSLHLLLKVQGNIAEFLLDVTDNFTLGGRGEGVSSLGEDLHQMISQVTSSQIETKDSVRQGVALIDWNSVGDTITRVQNDTSGTARGVQGQYGLDRNVKG